MPRNWIIVAAIFSTYEIQLVFQCPRFHPGVFCLWGDRMRKKTDEKKILQRSGGAGNHAVVS